MRGILDGLTQPLNDEDLKGASFERSTPRLLEPDTEENLRHLFLENRWTDFLPIILPTEERVEQMLKGTSHPGDKMVGHMRPTSFREAWAFDVEKVAVNSVMAGARPQYMGDSGHGLDGHFRPFEQHDLMGNDFGRERANSKRNRYGVRHWGDGALQ